MCMCGLVLVQTRNLRGIRDSNVTGSKNVLVSRNETRLCSIPISKVLKCKLTKKLV